MSELNKNKIRVRFAPSPTGYMHVGNFRTALYTYLFAQKNKGDFLLRIEDTDQKRYIQDALEKLIGIINWAGFEYSEGVYIEDGKIVQGGDFGPYIQSERLEIYRKHAEDLIGNKTAYHCFCSQERLDEMRNNQIANKQAPMYDRTCLKLTPGEIQQKIQAGEKYVIRQKIQTDGITEYVDLIRGKISVQNNILDDQVLMKSDGYPTYNFANVVDDHLMEISHVFRGEEYVSSTPKYVQLYRNFGWNIPKFAHLPLLLNPDRTKLSKRQGDVAVEDYINSGYLKEAIINFVALLGWNPGEGSTKEIFSMQELIEEFDLFHVHRAGAIFDLKKLDWLNSQYIKKLSIDELFHASLNFWNKKDFYIKASEKNKSEEYLKKILTIEQERLNKLSEVGENNKFFFQDIECDKEMLKWKDMTNKDLRKSLEISGNCIENMANDLFESDKNNLNQISDHLLKIAEVNYINEDGKVDRGKLLWPLRVALTGEQKSPSPFEVAWVLGKEESLKRINSAIELLD